MKRILKICGRFLLITFITLVLLEFVLGVFFHFKDRNTESLDTKDFPYLYFVFNPGEDLNSYGMKTNKPVEKSQQNFRIVLTGGSVARGQGNTDSSIAANLERILNDSFQTNRIEVVNAGMSAYVLEQEFIFTQMVLQKYQPDMIISLSGFNDLYSFYLNRPFETAWNHYPHSWSDFHVVDENRNQQKFFSRFTGFFKNITRAVDGVSNRTKTNGFDWERLPESELENFSNSYWQIARDLYDFCNIKGIDYTHCLQPLRDYKTQPDHFIFDNSALSDIYQIMDNELVNNKFAISLTSVFIDKPEIFTDYCHLNFSGNKMIAQAIAENISPRIQFDYSPAPRPRESGGIRDAMSLNFDKQ